MRKSSPIWTAEASTGALSSVSRLATAQRGRKTSRQSPDRSFPSPISKRLPLIPTFQQGRPCQAPERRDSSGLRLLPPANRFHEKRPFLKNLWGTISREESFFPIRNIQSQVVGFIGRSPDNRGLRWLKQHSEDTSITTKSWLYGIDNAHRFIKHYRDRHSRGGNLRLLRFLQSASRSGQAGGGFHTGLEPICRSHGHYTKSRCRAFHRGIRLGRGRQKRHSKHRCGSRRHGPVSWRNEARPGPLRQAEKTLSVPSAVFH